MRKIQMKLTRAVAILLSLAMLLSCLSLPVFAETTDVSTETPVEQPWEAADEPIEENQPVKETSTEVEQHGNDPSEESEEPPIQDEPEILSKDASEDVEVFPDTQTETAEEQASETPDEPVSEQSEQSDETAQSEPPEQTPEEETHEEQPEYVHPLKAAVEANGYVYLMTQHSVQVYGTLEMLEPIFTAKPDEIMLVTAFLELDEANILEVRYLRADGEIQLAYTYAFDLPETPLTNDEVEAAVQTAAYVLANVGDIEVMVFTVHGEELGIQPEEIQSAVELPLEEAPVQPVQSIEQPVDESTQEDTLLDNEQSEETSTVAPVIEDEMPTEESESLATEGDFVNVTTDTKVFLGVDDSVENDYMGDLCMGLFVNNASVQVESIKQDSLGRYWYKVRFLYGDTHADGRVKWTEYDSVYVLASETVQTDEQDFTMTDYAFEGAPRVMKMRSLRASAMPGFSLRSIYDMSLGNFYVGQSGLQGSSGKDSDYLQIATHPGHGKIYATPHYLEGHMVYCLEHLLPGPGERVSGGSDQPTGPYQIVDIDTYMGTPGYSSIIYKKSTMHAIAWVLRHTVPFMELDRSDSDNRVWSRVAGQFAIREVIKQLEGSQYVRDYWQMDQFYAASNNAPAVYLEYARWLAANGIARAKMTGKVTVSNKSVRFENGKCIGTVTLSTDADLIRISKKYGTITGHTYGADENYYYLNSGDTITITSNSNAFSIVAESMSSSEEEAYFYVGVPQVGIQKILIPQIGIPYSLDSASVSFEIPYGSITVTKKDAVSGTVLAGATFDLMSGNKVIQSMTTGSTGVVTFSDVPPGTYSIRENTPPVGYTLGSVNVQSVTVTNGQTSSVTFANEKITARIKIVKTDSLTGEKLAGVAFKITRLSAPAVAGSMSVGKSITIVTDADGKAETGWLEWGRYSIEETAAPAGYVKPTFSTEMEAYENGKTYSFEVENEPAKGWLKLTKTDRVNGNPIAGVVFDVYYNDQYGEGLACTIVTDENGVAVSEPLRKGRYIVQERGATAGYVFEEIRLDATVHSDVTTELAVTNQPVLVKLKLYKRDANEYTGNPADAPAVYGDGVLTGAEFQVLAADTVKDCQGNVIHKKGDVVVASLKTAGEDASVTTEALWPGKYEIIELTPPVGYQPAKGSIIVDARKAADQSEKAIITYEGVITNKITYGAQAIVKILGDGTAAADPTRIETPEKGAEFRVYLRKAGSYDNACAFERDRITTDRNGYAMTKALPYGIYVLEQTKGKAGYEIKGPITFEIDGTESLVNPPPLTLSDQPILYRLKFIKMDSETGKIITLSNASFRLKDENGSYVKQTVFYPRKQEIETFTTDETGSVTLPETVTRGLYFIEEIKAPEGYLIRDMDFPVFVGGEGDQPGQTYELEIEIPNDPVKGHILLDKKGLHLTGFTVSNDSWGNEVHAPVYEEDYLAGAVFEVRAAEDIIGMDGTLWYQSGDLADTITTTSAGSDASIELPLGKYTLTEVSAPDGYSFDGTPIDVELLYADDKTSVVEINKAITNEYLPAEISLSKLKEDICISKSDNDCVTSELTEVSGEGFVFGLFNTKDIPYANGILFADTLVATGATDENGQLTFGGAFPHGDYYIRELSAPDGWKLLDDSIGITLSLDNKAEDENILRVQLPDAIRNELIHGMVTLTKTDITSEKTLPGAMIEVSDAAGQVIYRDLTDENGSIANIPVKPGQYTFREVYAPEGYALSEAVMTFTVDADGIVTGDTVIRDDYTRFAIEKHDENHNPLAGVEFGLIDEKDTCIMTARTDKNGIAVFEKIPFGSYHVEETKPLAGYLPADMNVEVTVDGTFINPDKPLATIVNCHNEVLIQKTNQDGQPLAGAEFALVDAFDEVFATAVSDENGMVRFTKIPYGSYTIREVKAPEGYLISKTEIPVTMDANFRNDETPLATVVNHWKRVQFRKVDTSGKLLPGVEFSLLNAITYEVVETAVSNEKGEFIFTNFDYGDWIVRETEAPEGYSRMEDYLLHVNESWTEPDPIMLVNIPDTYAFFKSDNEKNALAGAVFTVEDEDGTVLQEVTSGENGVVYIEGLTPGRFVIREKEAPEGFTRSEDSLEVVIDENYTHPAKLKRFVNYPSISTGVDISPNTVTWIGIGLVIAAGILIIAEMRKMKMSRKKRKR